MKVIPKGQRVNNFLVGTMTIASLVASPGLALASDNSATGSSSSSSRYYVDLAPLNNSGVTGHGQLAFENGQLTVIIMANGLTPLKLHPQHIHGKNNPEVASCPTPVADVNKDGYISVLEGAPAYGPIKLNLTSPQTPFGKPPTPALFTPFAGTADNKNFPTADSNGNINFQADYSFTGSVAARQALASLMPLEDQHVVLHGDFAPESVDAAAFAALGLPSNPNSSKQAYDPLLPVACGSIQKMSTSGANEDKTDTAPDTVNKPSQAPETSSMSSSSDATTAFDKKLEMNGQVYKISESEAKNTFHRNLMTGARNDQAKGSFIAQVQSARDEYVRNFYEARNVFVDELNRIGDVSTRDHVMVDREKNLQQFTSEFERMKQNVLAQK